MVSVRPIQHLEMRVIPDSGRIVKPRVSQQTEHVGLKLQRSSHAIVRLKDLLRHAQRPIARSRSDMHEETRRPSSQAEDHKRQEM